MADGKALAAAYSRAGEDLLATDLMDMFKVLTTPEEVAAHNIIFRKVFSIVKEETCQSLYLMLARKILEAKAHKSLALKAAESILGTLKG